MPYSFNQKVQFSINLILNDEISRKILINKKQQKQQKKEDKI